MRIVIAEDSALLRAGIERILADAGQDVVVQIAVADVAEDRDPGAGVEAFDGGRGFVDEFGDAADRDGDIVFPPAALGLQGR